MKKLVAISVLFTGLATAVSAQDGGWSNAWKVGLQATFSTDMFYAASWSGKSEATQDTTPVTPYSFASDGTNTWSREFGKYSKGSVQFFPHSDPFTLQDHRVMVTLRNTGENYDINLNMAVDNVWANETTVMSVINGGMLDDWGVRATAGIFNFGIGPWSADTEGKVDANAEWSNSWLGGWNTFNRFGVQRINLSNTQANYIHSNNFRTQNEWGNPLIAGIRLGDDFKFALGYKINPRWSIWNPGTQTDNRSSINGTFMFSGSPVDILSFDLFYSIVGKDDNTLSRTDGLPTTGGTVAWGYKDTGIASWNNIIGAYVQVKAIENLSLSVGYTVNFVAYEAGAFMCGDGDYTQSKAVTYNAPIYSGIDLRLGYYGIDKIGLKFNNNLSFAGVNGDKVAKDTSPLHDRVYKDKINLLFDESFANAREDGDGRTQGWFQWKSSLEASLGFIDGVGLQVSIGERLGVYNNNLDRTETDELSSSVTRTLKSEETKTTTFNTFQIGAGAKYGMGGVTLGVGLELRFISKLQEEDCKYTTTLSTGGEPVVVKKTYKSNEDKVEFGIPITFKLSF